MAPEISIITPSFNQGQFIEQTIRSVLDQQVPGVEYVVVDGGSGDSTLEILKNFSDAFQWVSRPDAGQSDAINKGVAMTAGPIVGWLNSDDVYLPGALAAVLENFQRHGDADVIYGRAINIDESGRPLGAYPTEPFDPARLRETCYISQPAAFVRRATLEKFGPLDIRLHFCMDHELWLRLAEGGAEFVHVPRELAATRVHRQTKTYGSHLAARREMCGMMKRRYGLTPGCHLIGWANAQASARKIPPNGPLSVLATLVGSAHASIRWNGRLTADWLAAAARYLRDCSQAG
ncbi:MAG: glycosyltransferase [Planctomycetes bacterium]|nr:glycosyltransferase [Planctomycetota bacterium]